MTNDEIVRYYSERLKEKQQALDAFNSVVAKHGLRISEWKDQGPERDVTEERRKDLETAVEEYSRILRHFSERA
jgi:hypothetical protein